MGKGPQAKKAAPSPAAKTPLPKLSELHLRHQGVTRPLCEAFAEAAGVCLSRHHRPPVDFRVTKRASRVESVREVSWEPPDERTAAAWGNRDDTTRDGAYAMAIAAVEVECGMLAVSRAEVRSGADYYVAPLDAEATDLEAAVRLEVSGTDLGDESTVQRRLKEKVQQTKEGVADTPALACVVGFAVRRIAMEDVEAG